MELREILINPKLFKENFLYNENYLIEECVVKDVAGQAKPSLKCIPLRYRKNKLWVNRVRGINKTLYLPNEDNKPYKSGDWLCCLPTANKNKDGLMLRELEVIINFLDRGDNEFKGFGQLKKRLESRGIDVQFTPCVKCGSLANLSVVGDTNVILCESCKESDLCKQIQ